MGVQHPVQDVEALRELRGRHRRPADRLLAEGDRRRPVRSGGSTRTRSTSCRRCTSASASSCPTSSTATRRSRSRASASRTASATPTRATRKETQFYSMLGTRAIWHKGWKAATAVPAAPDSWGDFHQQKWELFDTDADPSECHDLSEQHPDKLQELIALWWTEAGALPGAAARVAWRARDPRHRAAAAVEAALALRLLPRRRGGPGVGRPEHPQPLVHDRRRGRDRDAGGRRRHLLAGLALRRPRPLRQGRQAEVRLQLGRRARADRRVGAGRPDRPRRPFGLVREGERGTAVGRDAHAAHPRREGRRGEDHDPAGQVRARRRRARRRHGPAPSPFPTTTRASGPGRSSAARSSGSRSTSVAIVRRPRAGSEGRLRAPVSA